MQEKKEKDVFNSKWLGILIVIIAIALIVLTIHTNFFDDMTSFEKTSGEEVLQPAEEDKTVGYSTGFVPATNISTISGEGPISGEILFTPRQRARSSGD